MTILTIILSLFFNYSGDSSLVDGIFRNQDKSIEDSVRYYDGHTFTIIGKYHDEKNYVRLPARYKNTVRDKVWNLSRNSAGISIRFSTNASFITVRWTVLNDSHLPHMADTGVKGVDLYVYDDGRWEYAKTGFPREKVNEATLVAESDGKPHEYLLNLPLYDGVAEISIGVNADAEISKPKQPLLVNKKPVVYYGTSIAQGGCASRPGLAFTNILARSLDRSFVNLGFSGNGTFETSVGEAMCEVDAALYVVDCNPNTNAELIHDRTVALVEMLKDKRPDVPVLLVEGFLYDTDHANPESNKAVVRKRKELKRAFETLKSSGITNLHYQRADNFIGDDHEGTVDGIHPNDLGMKRIADALLPVIKKIL